MDTTPMLFGQVAVVDDTPTNLHLLSNLLEDAGHDVRPFPTGKRALEGIIYSPPDLILLDIKMPGMNGYELCELRNSKLRHQRKRYLSFLSVH